MNGFAQLDDEFRVVVNGKDITKEVIEQIKLEKAAKVLTATKRLDLAAQANAERHFIQDGDGGGYVDVMYDPAVYYAFRRKWGADALRDKAFTDHCVKHGSAVRVKNRRRNLMVGYRASLAGGTGLASVAKQGSRFSKTF
jgi:hypothetical protein